MNKILHKMRLKKLLMEGKELQKSCGPNNIIEVNHWFSRVSDTLTLIGTDLLQEFNKERDNYTLYIKDSHSNGPKDEGYKFIANICDIISRAVDIIGLKPIEETELERYVRYSVTHSPEFKMAILCLFTAIAFVIYGVIEIQGIKVDVRDIAEKAKAKVEKDLNQQTKQIESFKPKIDALKTALGEEKLDKGTESLTVSVNDLYAKTKKQAEKFPFIDEVITKSNEYKKAFNETEKSITDLNKKSEKLKDESGKVAKDVDQQNNQIEGFKPKIDALKTALGEEKLDKSAEGLTVSVNDLYTKTKEQAEKFPFIDEVITKSNEYKKAFNETEKSITDLNKKSEKLKDESGKVAKDVDQQTNQIERLKNRIDKLKTTLSEGKYDKSIEDITISVNDLLNKTKNLNEKYPSAEAAVAKGTEIKQSLDKTPVDKLINELKESAGKSKKVFGEVEALDSQLTAVAQRIDDLNKQILKLEGAAEAIQPDKDRSPLAKMSLVLHYSTNFLILVIIISGLALSISIICLIVLLKKQTK